MRKQFNLILFAGLTLSWFQSHAQQTSSAMQAYDHAQKARTAAGDLYGKKNATPAEVAKAVAVLQSGIHYLDSTPVAELAQGNIYLKARKHDTYWDMSEAYALENKNDSALVALQNMFAQGSFSNMANTLQKDTFYVRLKTDPRFNELINKLKNQGNLWQGTAFKTAYKPELTEDEKVAGLSLLWSQAKYNFVYFDHLNIDWNQTYLDYLPQVRNAHTTAEYYKVLQKFYAQLKDGHTNVYVPDELVKEFYSRPPFRTELIEGRVFITTVMSDSLRQTGIEPGLEILKIDNEPVIAYAEQRVKPYQSSSTPQDMQVREFTYALLSGPAEKPVVLELKDKKGRIITKPISRVGYHDIKPVKPMEYTTLGNIGYLVINDFEHQGIIKQFDSLFNEINKTKGLIIDIRTNGGGNGGIGFNILSKLTNKPFRDAHSKVLKYNSRPQVEPGWDENEHNLMQPNGRLYYSKPVVLLISPRTFSAAEDFTEAFDDMKRGKIIGQPTGGSTGQPYFFNLPGGGTARVCAKRDYYPSGKEFVGIGINPTLLVPRTIKDLLNHKDATLNTALAFLNK